MDDFSCLNGWGFGNIATSAADASKFLWELLGTENLISKKYQDIMLSDYEHSSSGFRFSYYLGLMKECRSPINATGTNENQTCVFGHVGADWGSRTYFTGYNPAYEYGITISMNSMIGMNCDLKENDFKKNYGYENEPNCLIFDMANQFLSNGTSPRLKCP